MFMHSSRLLVSTVLSLFALSTEVLASSACEDLHRRCVDRESPNCKGSIMGMTIVGTSKDEIEACIKSGDAGKARVSGTTASRNTSQSASSGRAGAESSNSRVVLQVRPAGKCGKVIQDPEAGQLRQRAIVNSCDFPIVLIAMFCNPDLFDCYDETAQTGWEWGAGVNWLQASGKPETRLSYDIREDGLPTADGSPWRDTLFRPYKGAISSHAGVIRWLACGVTSAELLRYANQSFSARSYKELRPALEAAYGADACHKIVLSLNDRARALYDEESARQRARGMSYSDPRWGDFYPHPYRLLMATYPELRSAAGRE